MARLHIRQVRHLACSLGLSTERLKEVVGTAREHYEELLLTDPRHPNKTRIVVNVRAPLRDLQRRLYKTVLLPKLVPSPQSHGGVRNRDILTNVAPHLESRHILKVDISDFYPSVHYTRVYRLFAESLECSPDVSRILTRLCTYKYHLALGLITSPILADQILKRVDRRIDGACRREGLEYTRFVDDVAVSGSFRFEGGRVLGIIESILREDGFKANPGKSAFGPLDGTIPITGVAVRDGKIDATRGYVAELDRQLADLESLSRGAEFDGPYYTKDQVLGRIRFVCRLNPARKRDLVQKFRRVHWPAAANEAAARNLVIARARLQAIARTEEQPVAPAHDH